VDESPLLAMFHMEERRHQQLGGATAAKKDVPHLSFEISSDDGFHVESDSLTSTANSCYVIVLYV